LVQRKIRPVEYSKPRLIILTPLIQGHNLTTKRLAAYTSKGWSRVVTLLGSQLMGRSRLLLARSRIKARQLSTWVAALKR
jgi:hypothetical protein